MKKKQEKQTNRSHQRYILIIVFFLVLGATNAGTYFFSQQSEKVATSSSLSLLNPIRSFIDQKDLIINLQPLRDYLNEKYGTDSNVSIYFEYLPTGANIALQKDAEFYPASLLKVPVAMAVARKIERGDWKWTNELVLMSTDKNDEFGTLYKKPTNSTYTIEELVRRSLADSDNTAHFMLDRNLDIEEMKDVYDHMGLEGFLETEGTLSAKKYSIMFRALYSSSFLTEKNSQKLLLSLSQSPFNAYIQSALPEDIVFAHKIGIDTAKKVYLDSGIVYAKSRPYILTIMTKNKDEEIAQKIMADVSEKVYNYVTNYKE